MPAQDVKDAAWAQALDEGALPPSSRYYEIFRNLWLEAYPETDANSRRNLESFIKDARSREAVRDAAGVGGVEVDLPFEEVAHA